MANSTSDMTLAQIGAIFNDATTQMLGGIYDGNRSAVIQDLQTVRADLSQLLLNHPDQFQGQSAVHIDVIDRQLTLEIATVRAVGTDALAPKQLNDIHRDITDIVQADQILHAAATDGGTNGFAPLPPLLNKPAPFQDTAAQTEFLNHYIADATTLSERAQALAGNPTATPAQTGALIHDIQAFAHNANSFTLAQGGIYSARFNNELALHGTDGAAAHDLIKGLKTGSVDLVNAAAEVLTTNAADLASNQTPLGGGAFAPSLSPIGPTAGAVAAAAAPDAQMGHELRGHELGGHALAGHGPDEGGMHIAQAHHHEHVWG